MSGLNLLFSGKLASTEFVDRGRWVANGWSALNGQVVSAAISRGLRLLHTAFLGHEQAVGVGVGAHRVFNTTESWKKMGVRFSDWKSQRCGGLTSLLSQANVVLLVLQMSWVSGEIEGHEATLGAGVVLQAAFGGSHGGVASVLGYLDLEATVAGGAAELKVEGSPVGAACSELNED